MKGDETTMNTCRLIMLFMVLSIFLIGCNGKEKEPELHQTMENSVEEVTEVTKDTDEEQVLEIEMIDTAGVDVGIATITEKSDGVHITVVAHHLQPGLHGFHIHEKGACETPDFTSAGGHFNPFHKKHGFDHPNGPHAGDLQNIRVNDDGTIETTVVNHLVTLKKGEKNSLFSDEGTTLIIHERADDYVSQPAGDAGDRIVCGVIYSGEN